MVTNIKGSETEELLSMDEACRILHATKRTVYNMVKNGLLTPIYKQGEKGKRSMHFVPSDVHGALSAQIDDDSLHKVSNTASRALALAADNSHKIKSIIDLLGITETILPFDKEGVNSLSIKAEEDFRQERPIDPEKAMFWGKVLMQMGEEYIELVRKATLKLQPWRIFMSLGERISREYSQEGNSPVILAYVEAGRRHFRNSAYFYIRGRCGVNVANKECPNNADVDDVIISIMRMQ